MGRFRSAGALCRLFLAAALVFCGLSWAEAGKVPILELAKLQGRIEKTVADGEHGTAATLAAIEEELAAFLDAAGEQDYHSKYWKSYLLYQQAVNLMSTEEFERADAPLKEAIETLKGTTPRDVEVVALLGLAAGLQLAYVPRHRIIVANNEVNGYLTEALELDAGNVRARFANAVADYNVPEEYGGKLKVESLLKDVLAKKKWSPSSGLAPRWGRREAATLIARFYLDENRIAEARDVLANALAVWPNDPRLRRLNEEARKR